MYPCLSTTGTDPNTDKSTKLRRVCWTTSLNISSSHTILSDYFSPVLVIIKGCEQSGWGWRIL